MTWSPTPTRRFTECIPGDTRGPKRLWDAPAGVVSRERGDVGRLVAHDYLCPVHGRFEVQVPSSDVPDEVLCAVHDEHETMWGACGRTSPWSPGTAPAIWPSSGEVMS